jgi:2-haloacid dehalogenase
MNRRNFLGAALVAGSITPALPRDVLAADPGGAGTGPTGPAPAREGPAESERIANELRICVFDTFGTVVDWRSSVIAEVEKLAREKSWELDAAEFADAWRANYGPSRNRVRTGELPWTKLDDLHRMTLNDLLVRYRIQGLTEDEKAHLNKVWHRLHPWPDAPEGLARLRTRYVLSPLSNGNVALLTEMAKFGGLPWDCILGSDVARHYKPDKEMYMMPGEFFDLPPSAVLMVAAHPGDLDSAKSYGLRTAYVHRPFELGLDRERTEWPESGRFDFLATDFNDLASQLGIWTRHT